MVDSSVMRGLQAHAMTLATAMAHAKAAPGEVWGFTFQPDQLNGVEVPVGKVVEVVVTMRDAAEPAERARADA